jgi:DNA repair protein RecO (recombination protein O)
MPAEESTPAIVLRARDYLESDRIVTLLTRDLGKLAGIAKGAKASRRRFERKLEPFSHVMLYFRRRPHGQLVFITRAEAVDLEPYNLHDDLGKIALGSYMLELSDAFTSEADEAAQAYRILAEALGALARSGAACALRQAFELKLLGWAGFGLEFARCRVCRSEHAMREEPVFFVTARGGTVCARCRAATIEGGLRLEPSTGAALAALSQMSLEESGAAAHGGADGALALSRFIASVLDRRLRSAEFLDSVLPPPARA